jgi:hypothetical protein
LRIFEKEYWKVVRMMIRGEDMWRVRPN